MPFTVNGVGTRYYGRANLDSEAGVCEFCRRPSSLQSYRTTLWFTIVYLPILPLGKKQILGECGACRKHRVLPQHKWEALCSQTIADAQAAADAAPLDPLPAIQLLGALLSCFEREAALAQANDMTARFPHDTGALMAAGACFEKYDHAPEAERAFWAALNADPANLLAKRAIVWRLIERRDLPSAEQLLSAAPPLTAAHDPGLFVKLGHAYQAEGRSAEAVATFAAALAVAPQLGQDPLNRKSIAAAERAAGATSTLLPGLPLWRRFPWLAPALGAAAVAAIALAANLYIAEHQTLHIVNGFATPLTIRFEDGRQIEAPPHTQLPLPIAEGRHVAQVSSRGRDLGSEPFEISNGFWRVFSIARCTCSIRAAAPRCCGKR